MTCPRYHGRFVRRFVLIIVIVLLLFQSLSRSSAAHGRATPARQSGTRAANQPGVSHYRFAVTPATVTPTLISGTVLGNPVAAGDYVFWVDGRDYANAIYGYHLGNKNEFLVQVLDDPFSAPTLATDGNYLAWTEFVGF